MTFFGNSDLSALRSPFGGSGAGRTASRTDILGRQYAPFSNPFFDQAGTYMPKTMKGLFEYCRYYFLTHGVINSISTKSAEYPITDIIFQSKDQSVQDRWEEMINGTLNYRVHQFQMNLDFFVYGNSFTSPSFPFRKKIICGECNAKLDALETRKQWRYTNFKFWLQCKKCGSSGFCKSYDEYYTKPGEVGMVRWSPENMTIFHNESTGRKDYALDLSKGFRSNIVLGRKDLVATTPKIFLDAAKEKRMLVFDKREVFHMSRPALSGQQAGWGTPQILPVLKDAFYMQVMKKAQESALLLHLLPQIFLFPQPASGSADPFTSADLGSWRNQIQRELTRQRMDPGYMGIVPFPIGHQVIGDNGRQLLLMPEIRAMAELIGIGMGFPIDLVFGQGNFAGTSVSMRMLENFFLSNVSAQKRLLDWTTKRLGAYMGWPPIETSFKKFKMADDLQRQAYDFQLNQAGKLSDSTLLAAGDHDIQDETELQLKEAASTIEAQKKKQLALAEIQGESQVIMTKYQNKANKLMMEAQSQEAAPDLDNSPFAMSQSSGLGNAQGGVGTADMVNALATQIKTLDPALQAQNLQQIAQRSPALAEAVQRQLSEGPEAAGIDMRPAPEQLPARREVSSLS